MIGDIRFVVCCQSPPSERQQWDCGQTHCKKEPPRWGGFFTWATGALATSCHSHGFERMTGPIKRSRHHLRVTAGLLSTRNGRPHSQRVNVWFRSTAVVQSDGSPTGLRPERSVAPCAGEVSYATHTSHWLERPLNDPVELRLLSAHGQDPAVEPYVSVF